MSIKFTGILLLLPLLFTTACSSGGTSELTAHFTKAANQMTAVSKQFDAVKTAPEAITALKEGTTKMVGLQNEQAPLRKKYPRVRSLMKDDQKMAASYTAWRAARRAMRRSARELRKKFDDKDVEKAYRDFRRSLRNRRR